MTRFARSHSTIYVGENLNDDVSLCSIPVQVVLPDLIKLSTSKRNIRILNESAVKFKDIGAFLLRDDTGARVSAIANTARGDQVEAVRMIYVKWMEEDEDHSWKKLIQCLRDVQLNCLARDLELHFGLTSPSDRGKVNVQGDTLPAVVHENLYMHRNS